MKKCSELREQFAKLVEAELGEYWDKLSFKGVLILSASIAALMCIMSLVFILSGQLVAAVSLPMVLGCALTLEFLISASERCRLHGIIDKCQKQESTQEDLCVDQPEQPIAEQPTGPIAEQPVEKPAEE